MSVSEANVVNAAKAWYRGLFHGSPGTTWDQRKQVVNLLPPGLRRLALMVEHLETEDKKKQIERRVQQVQRRKSKKKPITRGHLRLIK